MDRRVKNLTLDGRILELGEELAGEDRRTFSAEIEWLIEREYRRRQTVPVSAGTEREDSE